MQSGIKNDIDFKYYALSSKGLQKSVTTAAILGLFLPFMTPILFAWKPYVAQFISVTYKEGPKPGGGLLVISNKTSRVIDLIALKPLYNNTGIGSFKVEAGKDNYLSLIAIPMGLGSGSAATNNPFTGAFSIQCLKSRSAVEISLTFADAVVNPFIGFELLNSDVALIANEWDRLWANLFFNAVFAGGAAMIIFACYYYFSQGFKAWIILDKLIMHIESDYQQRQSFYRLLSHAALFEHWGTLANSPDNPKQFKNLPDYLKRNNFIYSTDKYIYIAPINILGNPTFYRFFGRNRHLLKIDIDDAGRISKVTRAFCKNVYN